MGEKTSCFDLRGKVLKIEAVPGWSDLAVLPDGSSAPCPRYAVPVAIRWESIIKEDGCKRITGQEKLSGMQTLIDERVIRAHQHIFQRY